MDLIISDCQKILLISFEQVFLYTKGKCIFILIWFNLYLYRFIDQCLTRIWRNTYRHIPLLFHLWNISMWQKRQLILMAINTTLIQERHDLHVICFLFVFVYKDLPGCHDKWTNQIWWQHQRVQVQNCRCFNQA